MSDLKAGVSAGEVDYRELEVVHELKALLGARLVEERVFAVGSGSKWDHRRNTSRPGGVAPGALADLREELRRQEVENDESLPQRWSRHERLVGQGSFLD